MKIANIDREILRIFWMTWGNSMKFSGKMCFKIMLKVTKNQGFTLSLEDTIFEKPHGRSNWPPQPPNPPPPPVPYPPLSRFRVNVSGSLLFVKDSLI